MQVVPISIYDHQQHSKKSGSIDLSTFFDQIKTGKYKEKVNEIRFLKSNFRLEEDRAYSLTKEEKLKDEKYQKAKLILEEKKGLIHRVTISGSFGNSRKEADLIQHSGYIDIDLDKFSSKEDLLSMKNRLIQDKHCVACFVSCGGDGLAFIMRVDGNRHLDAWEGIKEYLFNNYQQLIDPAHKSIANTRNASYDPDIYVNPGTPPVFKEWVKVKKKVEIKQKFVHSKTDFDDIINEIVKRRIDFCPSGNYEVYRDTGFAIASKFGDSGLDYFISCCQNSEIYDATQCKKAYYWFCKNPNGGITIATFYARCKEFNIEITSKATKRIATVASAMRKGGKSKETAIENLVKHEGFKTEQVQDIVTQVFDEKIEFEDSESILNEIEAFIEHNYNLKKNAIIGKLENDGVEWNEEDLNGLFISIKKIYDKADAKWIERIVFSPFIPSYNPLREYFESSIAPDEILEKHEIPTIIKKLWSSIETDNSAYLEKFGTKWLVSVVSSIFGQVSNLELDFTGKIAKGKSYFFENILPKSLSKYFAESDLSKEKDDEILMTQKAIILMNECSGKTRADEKKHKRLLDKNFFSIRKPYRKDNEDIQRIAVLCGTSNPMNLQSDAHGNRRIIYVNVISRNHKMYDDIDKDELWAAIYYLWKQGYDWKILDKDIEELNKNTMAFNSYSIEYEMIVKHIEKSNDVLDYLMAGEIKTYIETRSNQKLSLDRLINELRRLGIEMESIITGGIPKNVYRCKFKDENKRQIISSQDYF